MTATNAPGTQALPRAPKVVEYLRLGKARIYHHAYGWLLAALLLRLDGLVTSATALSLVLMLVMVLATQWAGGASDDLGGFRDGSDARNYAGRPARTMAKKPLLTGALSESEAVRFGVVCWTVGIAATVLAAFFMDGTTPAIAVVLLLLVQIAAVQYSIGLKLSYRPSGLEVTIFFVLGSTALMPYWFVAGRLNAEILLTSALVGLWFLMVVCYGNASDRAGDSSVSRRTLAVLLPPTGYRVVLAVLFAASVTLLTALFATTRIEPWLAFAVLPLAVLQAVQLYYGAGRADWRRARFLGLMSLDLGCVGLALAFLFS